MRRKDPDQLSIFEKEREKARAIQQKEHVSRVRGKIHLAIIGFFRKRRPGTTFTGPELHHVIKQKHPSLAPDSPGRIMRLLRTEGLINYKVVSRKDSLYEVLRPEENRHEY